MRFLISTENEILLFPVFGLFEKIFSLKMFSKIQPNAFPSPFSISSENENRKQPNQIPRKRPSHHPNVIFLCETLVQSMRIEEIKISMGFDSCFSFLHA